jgi:hypothetical protein
MFRALLAHPQEALHKRPLVYCVRVMSVCWANPAGDICLRKPRPTKPMTLMTYLSKRMKLQGSTRGQIFSDVTLFLLRNILQHGLD